MTSRRPSGSQSIVQPSPSGPWPTISLAPWTSTARISPVPQWANHNRFSCHRGDSTMARPSSSTFGSIPEDAMVVITVPGSRHAGAPGPGPEKADPRTSPTVNDAHEGSSGRDQLDRRAMHAPPQSTGHRDRSRPSIRATGMPVPAPPTLRSTRSYPGVDRRRELPRSSDGAGPLATVPPVVTGTPPRTDFGPTTRGRGPRGTGPRPLHRAYLPEDPVHGPMERAT